MTSGVGFFGASHLLLKLHTNLANEDDLRRIAECEARLMLAGFGNYHDLRKPGVITKNYVLGIGEKLNNVDGSEGKRIFCDLDEQLRLAGFDDPFDAENIKEIVTILRPYVARYSGTITNKVSDETPRSTEVPRQPESTSRVGILTALNLLYELEMGIINEYELKQLAEYEKLLKTGKDIRAEVSSEVPQETTIIPVEDNQWAPPTLGTLTNKILTELSTKLARTKDTAAKDLMLEEFEKLLQHAGFGNHYEAPKIEELMNELEDLRRACGNAFNERARGNAFNEQTGEGASEIPITDRKELLPEVSVKVTPDVSSEIEIKACKIQKKIEKLEKKLRLAGFGENCSTTQIQELRRELENLKMSQDKPKDNCEALEVSPKASSEMTAETAVKTTNTLIEVLVKTSEEIKSEVKRRKPVLGPGFVTATYLNCQLEFGDATEYDRRKLAQYEERLKAAGFGSDVETESAGTLGKITNAFIKEYNKKLAETSDIEGRNLISHEYEEHLEQAGFYEHYSVAQFEEICWTGMAKDLRKAKNNDSSDLAETSKDCLIEVLRKEDPVLSAEVSSESSREAASTEVPKTNEEASKVPTQTSSEESSAGARNTQEKTLVEVSDVLTCIAIASYLLFKVKSGQASDDELQKLTECEERLKLAGFSSDSTDQTGAPEPYPGLGKVTYNFFSELNAKMQTDDHETRNHIFVTYIEKLQYAGFAGKYSFSENGEMWNQLEQFFSMQYKNIKTLYGSTEASRAVPIDAVFKASNQAVDENTADEISNELAHDNSKEVVGDKATGMTETHASESADENSGQVAVEIENKITVEKVEEHLEEPCVTNENAAEVAREDTSEPAEKKQLLKLDSLVETARPCQSRETDDSRPKDICDEHTSNAGAVILEVLDNLPKTGMSAAFHIVLKVQTGQASDDEIKKLRECEEKLMLAEIGNDNIQATVSEPLPALGTITFNLLQKFSVEINTVQAGDREATNQIFTTYVNKLKFAGFDTISKKEEIWNELEFVLGTVYKATEAPKAVSNEKVQSDAETSKVMTDEISNKVPDTDISEVSGKVVKEKKKVSIENEHGDEALVENSNPVLDEDTEKRIKFFFKEVMFEMACEKVEVAGEKASVVVKDNTAVEKGQAVVETNAGCKSNKNATDEARESTSESADKTCRLVKLDLPVSLVGPSKTVDTNLKDPRITNVPINLKPKRKMVVARRRLKQQAPIDWFSTDGSKPPPDFDNSYTRLYPELPLSCRANAFSTRLVRIKEQLKSVSEPLACLLRKEYSNVVEAFDRYLSTVQKRASMEPTNSRWTRVQPNQEKWRREIIFQLFMSLDNLPGGFQIRPLDFSQPLTIRASFVAERFKMVEVKLGKADAQQALVLSKEFSAIVASFATRWGRPLDCPIPGEPYDDRTSRPLPDELEHLRQDKNRAEREYKWFPSAANKQVRDQLTNVFKRQLAIWKDSQV